MNIFKKYYLFIKLTISCLESEQPWLPSEDKVLQGLHNVENLQKIMNQHGKKDCIDRTNFLESEYVDKLRKT